MLGQSMVMLGPPAALALSLRALRGAPDRKLTIAAFVLALLESLALLVILLQAWR